MSDKNIWAEFAKLNGMSPEEFLSEMMTATIAAMSMELDKSDTNTMKTTQGQYVLVLIDTDK